MTTSRAILVAVLLAGMPARAQTVAQALEAIENKNFPKALGILRPLAEQGNPEAEYNLGVMYWYGRQGLPQNYTDAFEWFRKAGAQGFVEAQYRVAQMYSIGQGRCAGS